MTKAANTAQCNGAGKACEAQAVQVGTTSKHNAASRVVLAALEAA
ncbi:hypothetical protein HNQ50_000900 [Silvimonas terrae]|uniref:Uncharacterized protein n=1 Tax=Silvimonas terrae TaxID=300266 RepID=A0A840RCC1_9NEIS|nr:hypothetical protein [Silvimonas terrae]